MNSQTTPSNRTPEKLLTKIAESFPDLSWHSYQYIDEGWDHQVIILDKQTVFRFPTDADYISKLRLEMQVLDRLHSTVPAIIPLYTYKPQPLAFGGYSLVPGGNLTKAYFDTLRADEVETLATKLAAFLSAIHAQPIAESPFNQLEREPLKEDQIEVRQRAKQFLAPMLDRESLTLVNDILHDVDELAERATPEVFIHNDMYSRHLFWNAPQKQLGVIDFSDMGIGDPAIDFAELHEYGFDFVNTVYKNYDGLKDSTFLSRAWTYQKWIGVYMMVDHFVHHKTTFEVARETFDRVVKQEQARTTKSTTRA